MNNIKACLFDLDGVIVDTAKYHYLAWKRLADEMSIPFNEEDNERFKGVSRMACMEILCEMGELTLSDEEKIELTTKKNNWYVEYISKLEQSEVLPGAREFLQDIKEKGYKIALGSASKNSMAILRTLNLVDYFDAIIDGTKVSKAKPDPEVFLEGAKAVGIAPAQCVVFEDAEAGIEAAIAGGMKSIGIGSPTNLGKANFVVDGLHQMTIEKLEEL